MASDSDIEQLVESREQEDTRLQILMSQRRKRKLDSMIDEEASAASSPVTRHRQDVSRQALLVDIWLKAAQLHGTYAQQNVLEKAFVFLTMNSVINLTFDYPKLANINTEKFDDYKEENGFAQLKLRQLDANVLETIKQHVLSESPATGRFVDCSVNIFSKASKGELTYYRIYSHFLMIFEYQKESINSWRTLSENDIFRLFSSPIFEIIFEHSVVKLRSGETTNVGSAEVRAVQAKAAGVRPRGAFKVDLRLVLLNDKIEYDLANCEFAKSGDIQRKVLTDNAKVVVEAKCIMDFLVLNGRLNHEEAKKIQVVNLQACGLKMKLVALKLDKNGNGYVAQPIGKTIKLPTSLDMIPTFFEVGLPLIQHMKDTAEKNAMILQDAFNRDRSDFGSQSPPHPTGFIKKTWLGPSPSRPNSIPPMPY